MRMADRALTATREAVIEAGGAVPMEEVTSSRGSSSGSTGTVVVLSASSVIS
jgi:hypothetical protein